MHSYYRQIKYPSKGTKWATEH